MNTQTITKAKARYIYIYILALGIVLFGTNVKAESSGWFVGGGIGVGGFERYDTYTSHYKPLNSYYSSSGKGKNGTNIAAFATSVLSGYKHFFTDKLGIRGYGSIDYFYMPDYIVGNKFAGAASKVKYGIGADFLYTFLQKPKFDLGAFAGLWLGGESVFGKAFDDLNKCLSDIVCAIGAENNPEVAALARQNTRVEHNATSTIFQAALNLGMRSNILANHGIEAVISIPFVPHNTYHNITQQYYNGVETHLENRKGYVNNTWNLMLRYLYNF